MLSIFSHCVFGGFVRKTIGVKRTGGTDAFIGGILKHADPGWRE